MFYLGVHFEDKQYMGNLTEIGYWENYFIYEVEEHVLVRWDFQRIRPVVFPSKEVAMGYLFAHETRPYLRVGAFGHGIKYLGQENCEPYKNDKFTYYLKEQDIENGLKFAKLILREKVSRDYDNLWRCLQPRTSSHVLDEYVNSSVDVPDSLTQEYAERDTALYVIANILHQEHQMIDALSTTKDVQAYLAHHYVEINAAPQRILDGRKAQG